MARGLSVEEGALVAIDGAKALAAGIDSVLGTFAVIPNVRDPRKHRAKCRWLPHAGELADTVDAELALRPRLPPPRPEEEAQTGSL